VSRGAFAWLLTLPLVAAGVLAGHAVAYRLTGEPLGDVHDYLEHAPQLGLVLAALGLVGLALQQHAGGRSSAPFAVVALVAFAVQEHAERFTHGEPALLVTDRTFLVGLVLQVPVAVACIAVARTLVKVVASARRPSRPPRLSLVTATVVGVTRAATGTVMTAGGHGRAPPALLQN